MEKGPQFWTIEAFNPLDPSGCVPVVLRLGYSHTRGLGTMGLEARYARMMLIPEVVKSPTMVLQGWKREGYEEALIYVGRPSKDFRSPTIETPPPKGMVFMVFVTPDTHTIADWRWEPADPNNPDSPEALFSRCERKLWPTNQGN